MKIEPTRPTSAASSARRVAAGGFALPAEQATATKAASAAAPTTALDALLALQAEEGPTERRARQVRRAARSLDGLDTMQKAFLGEGSVKSARAALMALEGAWEPTGDPGLDDLLREIEVRRAVELAKLERA